MTLSISLVNNPKLKAFLDSFSQVMNFFNVERNFASESLILGNKQDNYKRL